MCLSCIQQRAVCLKPWPDSSPKRNPFPRSPLRGWFPKMGSSFPLQILLFFLCLHKVLWSADGLLEENEDMSMVVGLRHRGFKESKAMNPFELLRISRNRSSIRLHSLRRRNGHLHHHGRRHSSDVSLPLRAGGDYIMPLLLGSPPQRFEVFMDTGSDLVWVPCSKSRSKPSFECIMCGDSESKNIPTFFAFRSHSRKHEFCSTDSCAAVHNSDNVNDLCTMAGCPFETLETSTCLTPCPPFYYAYGDGSLRGDLIKDSLTVHLAKGGKKRISNFTFGCAGISFGESVGVAGFGRGVLPFPAQLGKLGNKVFSYCLVSHRFDGNLHVSSPLLFGESAIPKEGKILYTPMINNFKHPYFYYLGLEGISIGGQRLKIPLNLRTFDNEGNGGLIVDSGTTFTMLPEPLYKKVLGRLKSTIRYPRSIEYEEASGLDLCYEVSNAKGSPKFPSFSFHFQKNATVTLPIDNYFFIISDSGTSGTTSGKTPPFAVGCLIILSGGDEVYGPAAVLGNFQQQNFHIVYDMEKLRVGFVPKTCAPIAH